MCEIEGVPDSHITDRFLLILQKWRSVAHITRLHIIGTSVDLLGGKRSVDSSVTLSSPHTSSRHDENKHFP